MRLHQRESGGLPRAAASHRGRHRVRQVGFQGRDRGDVAVRLVRAAGRFSGRGSRGGQRVSQSVPGPHQQGVVLDGGGGRCPCWVWVLPRPPLWGHFAADLSAVLSSNHVLRKVCPPSRLRGDSLAPRPPPLARSVSRSGRTCPPLGAGPGAYLSAWDFFVCRAPLASWCTGEGAGASP